jgi:hypothetical protein
VPSRSDEGGRTTTTTTKRRRRRKMREARRDENARAKSLRIGVHHANAVVWGPV